MNNPSHHHAVSVIVNVYNEAATIESEILSIHSKIMSKLPGSELIIAEDGSTDGTKEIIAKYVRDYGVIHSTGLQRKGYAQALRDAMNIAKKEYIFFSDTGGKFDFDDFWKLYAFRDKYSLIIGVRSKRSDQPYRRFLTDCYNLMLRKYFHVDMRDADSGFRIYRKELIKKICKEEWVNTFLISSELTLRTLFSGGKIGYAAVSYKQRRGKSRALPAYEIFKALKSVLNNLPKLKHILTSDDYAKLSF